MICFPLDNTQYSAKALGAFLGTRTRGVFSAEGNLAVGPAPIGFAVKVSPGLAWLQMEEFWGAVAFEETETTLQLAPADGELARIDAVCLRLNKNRNEAELVIKQGSYAISPTISAPARDLNADEIYLATVYVAAGMVDVAPDRITDQRLNEEYCGLMRDGVTGIPTEQLYEQFYAWFAGIKDVLDEETAGHLLNLINSLEEGVAEAFMHMEENMMPISGGTFDGPAQATNTDRSSTDLKNSMVTSSNGSTQVSTSYLKFVRK